MVYLTLQARIRIHYQVFAALLGCTWVVCTTASYCPPGNWYRDDDEASGCVPCASGMFQASADKTSCDMCTPGKFYNALYSVDPSFVGVSTQTQNIWGVSGIRAWKLSGFNENCDQACDTSWQGEQLSCATSNHQYPLISHSDAIALYRQVTSAANISSACDYYGVYTELQERVRHLGHSIRKHDCGPETQIYCYSCWVFGDGWWDRAMWAQDQLHDTPYKVTCDTRDQSVLRLCPCSISPTGKHTTGEAAVASNHYSGKGATACTACVPGTYSSDLRSSACVACRAGTYAPTSGASSCVTCSNGTMSVAGSTECRLSTPCPDWSDDVVNAATAALLVVRGTASDDIDAFHALNAFATHYARQPEGSSPPECAALYDRVAVKLSQYSTAVAGSRPRRCVLLATVVTVCVMTCINHV